MQWNPIRIDIVYKLWGDMTMNPVSLLTGATADRIFDDLPGRTHGLYPALAALAA